MRFSKTFCVRFGRMSKKARRFPPRWKNIRRFSTRFITHMVEAGETGGVLDLILQRLATLIEKVVKLKRSIVSASIYPAAVIFVAIAAIAMIMIVVIPQFEQIFLGLLGPGELLPLRRASSWRSAVFSPVGAVSES